MPTLEWIGKNKVVNHHQEVPFRVLERQYSFDEQGQHIENNGSENMIIHGDNLEALKALLPQYEGKVKCIYIDPPYNTGNEGWCYNDNVSDPHIQKWLGEVVGKEGEDLTRHDKWLCMMYPRLMLLQKLLADDGVIFISIDDNELYNLKSICDEIFGASCYVSDIAWQRTYSTRNDSKGIVNEVEHILVYSKVPEWNPNKLPRTEEMNARYSNPDNDVCAFCLKIPQSILMPSNTQELTKENLLSNFTLKGKPSNIDFDHLDNNLAQVDLDGDGTPRASKMESQYQQFIGQQFPLMPGENRLKLCRNIIHTTLSRQKKLNAVDDTELQRYVDYIIDGMNQGQLDALEQMPVNFANKICDYIIKLQEETARENFYNWLEVGKIVTQPRFKLTPLITLSGKASSLTKSLYKQECELDDNFEYDMAMALTGIDSVRWWHRNPTSGRNAFCLNAFRNHYPDFIVMTNSGKVLLVETKGDQLENAESREKIKLGRAWQNAAGSQYRYYMVFQNKDLHLEGAYRFDEFLKILGDL